jgi:glycosyltransferase involved in cell wall biosynthesis
VPHPPRVTVGIPVRNGENYLAQTLECFLGQTYGDLCVIVSDNASTDGTADIARAFAARDPRVRFLQQSRDLGAAENYNAVYQAAESEYFTWASHDDLRTPDWIEQAVAALDADPTAVLAISEAIRVDGEGRPGRPFTIRPELFSPEISVRFRAAMRQSPIVMIFGLTRADALLRAGLHGVFTGGDWATCGALTLQGRVARVDRATFYYRSHRDSLTSRFAGQPWWKRAAFEEFFAPARAGRVVFSSWRRFGAYVHAAVTAPVGVLTRLRLLGTIVRTFLVDDRAYLAKLLLKDVLVAARTLVARLVPRRRRDGPTGPAAPAA